MGQIKGLFVTVSQVLKHGLKTGKILADADTVERRLQTCRICEFLNGSKCQHCGCFMPLKGGLAETHCPVGKW